LLPGVGPAGAARIFTRFEARGFSFKAIQTGSAELNELLAYLADSPWEGQVQRVREWYLPHLERLYDAAQVRAGDLLQLEKIATQFADRGNFLTEMALDPPAATSDLSGEPSLDEDYLVLSTVHSAKGQEWEAVHILNVADGNFPSEFATGRADLIDEERRLLYVAMTRAKSELHVIAPLKYYVAAQSRMGDRHVYGAKSRFMSAQVMACMAPVAWGEERSEREISSANVKVDVAARLRGMWQAQGGS
ncbi:MAG: 3'-5' exonuclease, partial [Burkholderiales bacterium]